MRFRIAAASLALLAVLLSGLVVCPCASPDAQAVHDCCETPGWNAAGARCCAVGEASPSVVALTPRDEVLGPADDARMTISVTSVAPPVSPLPAFVSNAPPPPPAILRI